MNIAIISPSPVPFVMGGAENLWLGMQRYFNEETKHQCELFKLPTKEGDLVELLNSYKQHAQFDVTTFDQVITGKYPAWMTEHPSQVVYMLHTLRGLYDTYHFCNQPDNFDFSGDFYWLSKSMDSLMADRRVSKRQIIDFINELEAFISEKGVEANEFRFPGPFARSIIHFLDSLALRPERISKYAAISRTVRNRPGYFPQGLNVEVVYPPSRLDGYACRRDDFLFTTSRLDGPKRIGLLIEAMHHVNGDIQLLIGGRGPDESRLKELAAGNQQIVFLGQLTDQELIDYYADALAVPFVPYDEDYGLITIEAMKSGKPVITTTDSGGVLEFVKNDETGLIADPDPKDIARAINYMCNHRDKAREMGLAAKASVSHINWGNLGMKLLGIAPERNLVALQGKSDSDSFKLKNRRKMVVAVTFPIYPPRGGGQARVYHLYREWSKQLDITIVSLIGSAEPLFHGEIAPGLFEIRVPKSIEHELIETEHSRTVDWIPVSDIVAAEAIQKNPLYLDELEKACASADIVVASHPYLVEALLNVAGEADLWFEAHNVEYSLKEGMLPSSESAKKLLSMVKLCEEKSWKKAKLVFACTSEDIGKLEALYGPTQAEKIVVPNGFSVDEVSYADLSVRRAIKKKLGIDSGQPVVIFMGSWHGPNLDAVELIFEFADTMPSVLFLIVGSAGLKFRNETLTPNIRILGVIDEEEKRVLLGAADLAINPMTSGSGSNLKMLDYFAAGLPVLSTPFGARGIDVKEGKHYIAAEINLFIPEMTDFFVRNNIDYIKKMVRTARDFVVDNYSWNVISEKALRHINESYFGQDFRAIGCEYIHKFAFFNKTYLKDAKWSLALYTSFERFAEEPAPFYIVAPDHDLLEIKQLFTAAINSEEIKCLPFFIGEEFILSNANISKSLVSRLYADGNGWFVQQIVKLALGKSGLAENYFTIDSACLFLRHFDYKKLFFSNSGDLLTQASHTLRHDQYEFLDQHGELGIFQYNQVKISEAFSYIHETVGGNNESTHWYTSTTGIFSSYAILKFEEFLFEKGFDGIADAIYAAPYELTWYGEFVYNHEPIPFIPVGPSILDIVCTNEELSSLVKKDNDLLVGVAFQPPLGLLPPNDIMQIVKNVQHDNLSITD